MLKCLALLSLVALAAAASVPQKDDNALWNDEAVQELRDECAKGSDVSCIKLKVVEVMEGILKKDSFKVSETLSVVATAPEAAAEGEQQEPQAAAAAAAAPDATSPEASARSAVSSSDSWATRALRYLRSHELRLRTPAGQVTLSPRHLEDGRLDLSLQFDDEEEEETGEEGRSKLKKKLKKSKLKKILVPVAVLLLLKAVTVVPLVLGILGVKAWNALQLSFGSFVVSLALAVFQLCQKLARDNPPPPQLVSAHPGGWEASARAAPASADDLAFRAYRR